MTLADRFVRRGHDPVPLLEKGLITELTKKLKAAGDISGTSEPTSPLSITTIVNLISTLCRGSSAAAHVSNTCIETGILYERILDLYVHVIMRVVQIDHLY